MMVENKTNNRKKWLLPLLLTGLLLIIVIADQLFFTSPDAVASDEPAGTAAYAPLPNMEAIAEQVDVTKDVIYHDSENSSLDIYAPKNAEEPLPVILWIHGGGYVGGSKDSRQPYGMALAHSGYVVANMDYALAPERQYPGPILQANAALEFLQRHAAEFGGDMTRVFIGGDSAGAQIASQVSAVISNSELAGAMDIQPAIPNDVLRGAVLFCGLYNMETVRATGFPNIDVFLTAYTGTDPFESFPDIAQLSTVNHITADYPPVFISVGDADPFSSQSQELVNVLDSHEVPVNAVFFENTGKSLVHEYQYALDTLDAQETLDKTLIFLNSKSQ